MRPPDIGKAQPGSTGDTPLSADMSGFAGGSTLDLLPLPACVVSLPEGIVLQSNDAFDSMSTPSAAEGLDIAEALELAPSERTELLDRSEIDAHPSDKNTVLLLRGLKIWRSVVGDREDDPCLLVIIDPDRPDADSETAGARGEQTSFLVNLSHEIRTPLTSILGFSSILADEVGGAHGEQARLIERNCRRLLDTINSVLDLSRLDAGRVRISVTSRPIKPVLEEFALLLRPIAEEKGLSLHVEPVDPTIVALVDEAVLSRILSNLVSNAIKFTESGEVVLSARRLGDMVEISVRDTGPGMKSSFLPHIYDEFSQENPTSSSADTGSGLGLSITRRLVGLLCGEIRVVSTEGVGTKFRFTVPAEPEDGIVASTSRREPAESSSVNGNGLRILVVDDNADIAELMRSILDHVGSVDIAPSYAEATAAIAENRYDAILVDIDLNDELSGADLVDPIRESPNTATPLIAVTAYALPGDRSRILSSGFDYYVSKPFTRESLVDALNRALS